MNDKTETTSPAAEAKTTVRADRTKYKATRSATGAKSLNNGDAVAVATEGATIEEVTAMGNVFLGEDVGKKYAHLNVGMQRMNIGNRIRGAIAKMNKAEEGSGDKAFAKVAGPVRKAIDERTAKARAAAEKKQAEAKTAAEKKAA